MNAAPTAAARAVAPLRAAAHGRRTVVLDGWQLTRLVGEGSYTWSFRAKPADDAKPGLGDFIIKTSWWDGADESVARAILRRESVVSRLVQHEHLASVLVDRTSSKWPHLVLPYLAGITAEQLLRTCVVDSCDREVLLPLATACSIVRQTALAAEELHSRGWVHSGIDPASVVIDRVGHATLCDLGLTRRIGSEECQVEESAMKSFTPPELLVAHGRWSPTGDVYCMGLLLFQLATGRSPFITSDRGMLSRLHREHLPPDLRELRPTASRELSELVRRMLGKEPLRRPSAEQAARWLAEIEIAELATGG